MNKGIILTSDALLAAFTTAIMLTVIVGLLSVNPPIPFDKQQLESIGNDFLSVLQQDKTLNSYIGDSQADSKLLSQLQLLPDQYCANVTLKIYRYQSDFLIDETHNAVKAGCIKGQELTKVKRIFVDYKKDRFGLAEMELWLK